jgi:hypothetical protein
MISAENSLFIETKTTSLVDDDDTSPQGKPSSITNVANSNNLGNVYHSENANNNNNNKSYGTLTTASTSTSSVVTAFELQELKHVIQTDVYFKNMPGNYDAILCALTTISNIEKEKIFTKHGICIPPEHQQPYNLWILLEKTFNFNAFKRFFYEENRFSNLSHVKCVFNCALLLLEDLLNERERLAQIKKESWNRNIISNQINNMQHIQSLLMAMDKAIHGVANWKQAYQNDKNICSQIDVLTQILQERKELIQNNLEYLNRNYPTYQQQQQQQQPHLQPPQQQQPHLQPHQLQTQTQTLTPKLYQP